VESSQKENEVKVLYVPILNIEVEYIVKKGRVKLVSDLIEINDRLNAVSYISKYVSKNN